MSKRSFLLFAILCIAPVLNHVGVVAADSEQQKLNVALVKAVSRSKTAEVRALLRQGADPNTVGNDESSNAESSVLQTATINNDLSIVKMLLWRGANVNAKNGDYRTSALLFATRNKNIPIMKLLIKNGANVNSVEGNDWSPLSIAKVEPKSINDYAVIRLLRESGAKEVPASEG